MQIRKRELYSKGSRIVEDLLEFMASQPIVHACKRDDLVCGVTASV